MDLLQQTMNEAFPESQPPSDDVFYSVSIDFLTVFGLSDFFFEVIFSCFVDKAIF